MATQEKATEFKRKPQSGTILTCNSETFLLTSSSSVAPYLKAIGSRIALTSRLHNLLLSQCYAIWGSANRAAS